MNLKSSIKSLPAGLTTLALTMLTAATAHAQTSLQAQIVDRPLSSVDVSTYGLPANLDLSGGLTTVGIGTPLYLEADVNIAIPTSDITSVTWALTSKPVGSTASFTNSPLGTNVPIYEPSSRLVSQIAGRKLLRPDVAGQYTITATINTVSEGTTNVSQTITAGTYMGVQTCELCHSGGQIAQDKWHTWSQTLHAQVFAHEIDGIEEFAAAPMRQSCLQCHTVGYDPNPLANDSGFYQVETMLGWTIPIVLTNGNWASMQTNYPTLANLANVQCESCHGPGSQHATSLGNTNFITVSYASGDCNQCHDDAVHHPYGTEWLNSVHAVTTTAPAGNSTCVGCHTAYGFIDRMNGVPTTNTVYAPINCQTCHEPHGDTVPADNPHMIRAMTAVTLPDNTVITNGGEGLLCMECHHSRQNAAVYAATTKGSSHFGPHEGPQADMLEGVNGFTYGQVIPSSAHANAVTNTCITCHMQNIASTDPAFTHAGGHTFAMAANGEDLVAACQQCHGATITDFNFPLQDYDGNGVIEGVQTEVQNLLNKLSVLLPPIGTVKSSLNIDSTWTQPQLEAAYNWLFVNNDGSLGIHNTAYAVGLLKASIANLTGVSVPGGLPDSWVVQYFGSVNNPSAAPNANPSGDGIPNWMKYALGLNPLVPGVALTNGVVWDNVTALGDTNVVHIYTAAEVTFDTELGKYYQIQSIGSLSGGWQNIGNPIAGNGDSISYLTPTRNDVQQFFRVVTTTSP